MSNLSLAQRIQGIKLIAFDVDGIMTDGGLYLSDNGDEIKRFNSLDGHGLKMLKKSGVELAIITGRKSRLVEMRAKNLGIAHLYQGVEDKWPAMQELLAKLNIKPEAAAYMGDDVVDLPVMLRVGFAVTVPASPQAVRDRAHYLTQREGGHGAVRETCELIMSAQGTLDEQLKPYLS